MTNRSQGVVEGFAGLDVSAREISVARRAALVLSTRLESLLTLLFSRRSSFHSAERGSTALLAWQMFRESIVTDEASVEILLRDRSPRCRIPAILRRTLQ